MRYLTWVVTISIAMLAALVGVRFATAHRFASENSGFQGLAVNAPVDIVFLGSSHTRQAYDARLMEQKTGKKIFLVAYAGLDPVTMLPIVQHLSQAKERPRLLVVEVYSAMFGRKHAVDDSRVFFEAPPELKKRLLREYVEPPRSVDKLMDGFALLANRNNEAIVAYPLYRALLPNLSYHGAYEGKFVTGLTAEQFRALRVPLQGDLRVDPEQRVAFREIVRICRMVNMPVVFVETPMPKTVADLQVMRGLKEDTRQALAEEKVTYLDGDQNFPLDDPSLFADSNHLSTKGRAVFTERVAEWLMAQPR
ncbi:MAG TPA: hypothetical protein VMZ25_03470 [Terriglobales bacterium]|nr:hypothetical protein [Terriglobales bacterium]